MGPKPDSITVTVTIDNRRVTLEGPEAFVRAEVRRLTDTVASAPGISSGSPRETTREASKEPLSEAELVTAKNPANHAEIVAVLAYALRERGVTEFNEDDIRRAYLRARIRPPKVVGQAIRDAKNAFDYIESGSGRGIYTLSHHGERTVLFDLPRERRNQG